MEPNDNITNMEIKDIIPNNSLNNALNNTVPHIFNYALGCIPKIFEDKYMCMNDRTMRTEIYKRPELVSLVFALISTDIQTGKPYDIKIYATLLNMLIDNKMLTNKSWKRSDIEIIELFKYSPIFVVRLVIANIISFEEISHNIENSVISKLLSDMCIEEIHGMRRQYRPRQYPIYEINFMLDHDIPLNLSDQSLDDVKTIIRGYTEQYEFNINLLFANIFKNSVPKEIFTVRWSKFYTVMDFFSSNEFYTNFCKIHDMVIVEYGKYLIQIVELNSWINYELFLDSVYDDGTYNNNMFASKFITLLTIIEDKAMVDEYHINIYSKNYATLLKYATVSEIKKLKFNTIIALDLENSGLYNDVIFEILYETGFRDGVNVIKLREMFHRYSLLQKQFGESLMSILKLLLFEPASNQKKNINLLFLLLDKIEFSDDDFVKIRKHFAEFENDSVITTKLVCSDSKLGSKILKIFPNVLKNAFVVNFEKFSEKTECLRKFSAKSNVDSNICSNLEDELNVLNTLQKINNCDKFTCGICSTNFVECCYSCGHTICSECLARTSKKCPFCNLECEAKVMFFP